MNVCGVITSVITGILASLFAWWFILKCLSPKLKFGENISKLETKDNKSKYKYRFKFENTGCRPIIDIEVIVRLRIFGLNQEELPKNWEVIYLPTSSLSYNKIAILKPIRKRNDVRPILEIKTYECDYFQKELFSPEIREKSKNNELTLEDVMRLGEKSEFQIIIIGTDKFSWVKKCFESKRFTLDNIVDGKFEKEGLNVK